MTGFIYAIASGDLVKIGYSAVPAARLAQIRTGNSQRCEMIGYAPGSLADEAALHLSFAAHREHGEWFRPEGAVIVFLKTLPPSPRRLAVARSAKPMNALARARKAKGWGQARLAQESGISQPVIARFETGERSPKVWQVEQIASSLGVAAATLIDGSAAAEAERAA